MEPRDDYSKARIAKDRNFDGVFYFGVTTTGIFCRPSCPAPVANEKNVLYFSSIFEAIEHGLRPCRRCRPDINVDYYNGNPIGTTTVQSALEKIYDGYLAFHTLSDLATELGLSERHLRKLFLDNLGITPGKIARYHKALFANKLLLYSNQSVTDIAYASGFGSVRQFNDVFKSIFGKTPTEIRKRTKRVANSVSSTTLEIPYQQPFDFPQLLSFMKPRIMAGVEHIDDGTYSRTFRIKDSKGFFSVTNSSENSSLTLKLYCNDIRCIMPVYNRVKRMFDLDTDFTIINERFSADPLLSKGMVEGHVPRLPVAFDPFEFSIRAVLGQQVSVKAATTIAARIAAKNNMRYDSSSSENLQYFFPTPEELMDLNLEDIGLTQTRATTVKTVTKAVRDGMVSLSSTQTFDAFHADFIKLKGVGEWTVNYVAMRGLGMMDCFPAADLGIIKALTVGEHVPTAKACTALAEKWRPYRTYATLCLWNTLSN